MLTTALEMSRALAARQVSSVELVQRAFDRINADDPHIRAFISLADRKTILASAREIDTARINGEKLSPFAGVPVAVKDNIAVANHRLTCGSRMLENYVVQYDATAIKRLRDAGLLIVGKTNMDEFGFGSSTENSAFFPTCNPRVANCVPGGSSGGSAAAVAAGMVPWALGTDTGGSIRQPASLCGIVGIRPTYGRVSRYGLVAFASSMDQIGTLANTVDDATALLSIIMGPDEHDSTTLPESVRLEVPIEKPFTLGIPEQYIGSDCAPEVVAAVDAVGKIAKDLDWEVRSLSLPLTEDALSIYYLIAWVEAASNLARYDGIKYGYGSRLTDSYEDFVSHTRAEAFGNESKRRIMLGTFAASSGYYDEYYNKACIAREAVKREFATAFEEIDLLLSPASPTTAWPLGERVDDPVRMYMSDILSVPAALAGIPALTLPAGTDSDNRPMGVQLASAFGREDILIAAARQIAPEVSSRLANTAV